MNDTGNPLDEAAARRFDRDNAPVRKQTIEEEIYNRVGSAGVGVAAEGWLSSSGESQYSEEGKRKAGEIAIARAQVQIQAEYNYIQQKHSSFIRELESGMLFKTPANFDSDFKAFDLFADDSFNLISNKNSPDPVYVDVVGKNMNAARAANAAKGGADNVEAHIRSTQGDAAAEESNGLKSCHIEEKSRILYELGLIPDPCAFTNKAQIEKIEETLGLKFSDLKGMTLSEVKERIAWVGKFNEISQNKEEYQKLMQNADPRLDAFRDKNYEDLNPKERLQLASTVRDLSYEKQVRLLRIDMKEKGYSNEQIEERIAQISENRGLIEDKNLSAKWQNAFDLEVAGNIEASLRERIQIDIDSKAGVIQSLTFKKIIQNLPEDNFNKLVKDNNLDSNQSREQLAEQLRAIYKSSPSLQVDFTRTTQDLIAESDKKIELNQETQQGNSFLTNFSNFWKTPSQQSPIQETAKIASIAAVSPMAAAVIVAGNAITNAGEEKPAEPKATAEKPSQAQAAFDKLGDAAKAVVEKISEKCGCPDKKVEEKTTPPVPVERTTAPTPEPRTPEPLANNSAKPVNPNNLPQTGAAPAPSVG